MDENVADMHRRIFANNLRRYMEQYGVSQDDIVKKLGYSSSTVSDWCNAKKYPRVTKMQELADIFHVSLSDLRDPPITSMKTIAVNVPVGFEPLPDMARIPVVGQIACGEPITAEENIERYASAPERWKADFALICRGRSMEPKIMDGDLVAIRSDVRVETGQIAAVRINDEATLKKVYFYPERIILRPINDEFEDLVFEGEEMNKVSIEGKVIGLCRDI